MIIHLDGYLLPVEVTVVENCLSASVKRFGFVVLKHCLSETEVRGEIEQEIVRDEVS